MRSKITLCDYLAEKVPNSAQEILIDSGLDFPRPKNSKQLAALLKKYVQTDREIALKALARIHPDRELLESVERENQAAQNEINQAAQMFGKTYANPFNKPPFRKGLPTEIKMNAVGGCSMCGFDGYANCNGCNNCKCNNKNNFDGDNTSKNYMPLIIAVGVFAIMYAFLDKK
jgi:hypothetical protein